MKELVSSKIVPRITESTGIRISPIHEKSLETHIEQQAEKQGISFEQYCDLLYPCTPEFEALINVATTNETYFFREKLHFDFLQKVVFPAYKGGKIVVWSGACASGEEPISIYSLAISCGLKPEIYASDIDSNELSSFKKGVYTKYSLNQDGKDFHHLLEETNSGNFVNERFHLNQEIFQSIKIFNYNLASKKLPDFFSMADIIFLRNVFIYFDNNLRKEILKRASEKLIPGGILFLSVGEICCVGQDLIPDCLEKKNWGSVYFFVKKGGNTTLAKYFASEKDNTFSNIKENKLSKINTKLDIKSVKENFAQNQKNTEISCPLEVFTKVNMFLSQKKYMEAYEFLNNYNPKFSEKFYKEYYLALINKAEKKYEEAIKHLAIAETMCPTFWLAYFNHGLILKELEKEGTAKRCFEKSKTYLEKYIASNCEDYNFLIESFNSEYFYVLCKKYIGEVEKK